MGNAHPSSHRKAKPHKRKTIKLRADLCPIAEGSLSDATATIELGLGLIEFLAEESLKGSPEATSLLAKFGVEAKATEPESKPIIVYRPGGEVDAWPNSRVLDPLVSASD